MQRRWGGARFGLVSGVFMALSDCAVVNHGNSLAVQEKKHKKQTPEDVARVVDMAKASEIHASEAVRDEKAIGKVRAMALRAAPGSIESASKARRASLAAREATDSTRKFLLTVKQAVHDAAYSVIKPTMEQVMDDARAEAKREAISKAAEQTKLIAQKSKLAAANAMKPFVDVQKRSAATAGAYAARGNQLAAQSAQEQMDAQVILNQANQFMSVGNNAQAQKLRQQGMQMMNQAASLSSTANGFFGTADQIMKTLPQYDAQAAAAAYHAEVMVNPDAPPPSAPLVLAQRANAPGARRP